MADNVTLNNGSGGETCATDDVGGVQYQIVKLADGTADSSTVIAAGAGTATNAIRTVLASNDPAVALLTTIDADTSTLAGAVSGTEMQVDIVASLPAGTNAIGKLAANSGVDIGDVDILSVIPGTGATNLGKAEDAAHTSGDTGVMALGVQRANPLDGKRSGTDGDYEVLHISNQRLLVSPNIVQVIDNFSDHTSWTAFNDDTANIADETTDYVAGGSAVTFDKVNGTANTTYALINKTITAINFLNGITGAAYLQLVIYIPDTTNVTNAVVRLGTDSSNYGEWDLDTTTAANGWNTFRVPIAAMSSATGTGWSGTAVTYIAVGLQFGSETDTLAGIIADALIFNAGNVVEADITSTANIDSSNVNIQKIGNIVVARGSGNVSTGTQRVTIATDDANLAAIETNTDFGAVTGGGVEASALRVTLASDSTGVLSIDDNSGSLTVDNAGTFAVQAAQSGTWNIGTVTTVTTCSTVSTLTGGGVAHDSADSGNPHKIGAKASASLLGHTPVAAADRTDLFAGTDGALLVRDGSLEDIISEVKTNTDGASTAMTGAFAATASQRIYLTDIIMANSSASNITVDIRDGSAGSVLATFPVPAGGGVVHRFGRPLRFTANTAAAFDGSAAATTLSVTMIGFKSKA